MVTVVSTYATSDRQITAQRPRFRSNTRLGS